MDSMELRTHTRLWQVEKRLYKLYDFTLPVPVSVRMLMVFLGATIPWFLFVWLIGVPFAPPFGHLFWLAPPVMLAWWANKPVAEGKRLGELVFSQVNYWVGQAKHYARLTPYTAPERTRAHAAIWKPTYGAAVVSLTDPSQDAAPVDRAA